MGYSIQALATAKATRPMIASGRAGRYRKAASKMTRRKSAVSRPSRSFDSPSRSWYGMSTSTIFAVAPSTARAVIAGVKLRPSGRGRSRPTLVRRTTRMPLAVSRRRDEDSARSKLANPRLPTRRTSGILLA